MDINVEIEIKLVYGLEMLLTCSFVEISAWQLEEMFYGFSG